MPRHNPASDSGQAEGIVVFDETYAQQDAGEPADTAVSFNATEPTGNAAVSDTAASLEGAVAEVPTDHNGVTAAAQVLDQTIDSFIEPITDLASATGANTDQAAAAGAPDWDPREQQTQDAAVQFAEKFIEADPTEQVNLLNDQMQASGESLGIIAQRATEAFGNNDAAQLEGYNNDDRNEGFAAGISHVMNHTANFNAGVAGAIGNYHMMMATR